MSCASLVAHRFLHLISDLTAKLTFSLVDSILGFWAYLTTFLSFKQCVVTTWRVTLKC